MNCDYNDKVGQHYGVFWYDIYTGVRTCDAHKGHVSSYLLRLGGSVKPGWTRQMEPLPVVEKGEPELRPFMELRDTGLLWLINRVVFHPRGYALALNIDENTKEIVGWSMFGDGKTVFTFDEEVDDKHFAEVNEFFKSLGRME